MKLSDHIAAVPLFNDLPPADRERLAAIALMKRCKKGEIIFSQGDPGRGFYVVLAGRVKIFRLSGEGREQILHMFGPGEPFGEVPVFTGKTFPAYAEAIEETRALFFPRDSFVELVRRHTDLALNMMAVLSQRLHRFTNLIEDLSLREVPERIASYLLYLQSQDKARSVFDLDITKTQLANSIGTIPETMSRVLARMEKSGVIKLSGPRSIDILDAELLERIASGDMRLK